MASDQMICKCFNSNPMKTTVTVKVNGIDLEVEGYFTPDYPGTREEPPQAADFEIESIKLSDPTADIFELIDSSTTIEDIVNKACEAVESAND